MKKSGYRSSFHIYMIFFPVLLGTILAAVILVLMMINVGMPGGESVRSNWPKLFAKQIGGQIIFLDGSPQITQSGLEQLREHQIGVQILDDTGSELYAFQKPEQAKSYYSNGDLLRLSQTGHPDTDTITSFVEEITYQDSSYIYLIHVPVEVEKITMYLNGARFTGGKHIIFLITGILFLVVIGAGILYGFWTSRVINRLTASIRDIAKRSYLPLKNQGAFGDLYSSLNLLDLEIRAGDQLRENTETSRKEWIANITHDLKTPLSPIKGYAEILLGDTPLTEEQRRQYAEVLLKNAAFMEQLIDDLKLTYQLENGIIPFHPIEQNLVRFLKELIIDILNRPEYENRRIEFTSAEEIQLLSFDSKFLTRALQNLIINAFVHGEEETELNVSVSAPNRRVQIEISDNGRGMTADEADKLFERYYRGTGTENKTEGTGLGLAIAKEIIELHRGTISVSSTPGQGTRFMIVFSPG